MESHPLLILYLKRIISPNEGLGVGVVEILPEGAEPQLFVPLPNDELILLAGVPSNVDETPHYFQARVHLPDREKGPFIYV